MADAPKPVVLAVLDGFGVSLQARGNAIAAAATPTLDGFDQRYPFTLLQASGLAVGLPWGEAGNSEVGHLTMGAGRAIYHHLPRISMAIRDGSFFENPALRRAAEHAKSRNSSLHLVGLVSSGSAHSYLDHLWALFELARRAGVEKVCLHAITDGKDAPPREAAAFLGALETRLERDFPGALLASLIGRFYAMDRDGQWPRVRAAYELLTSGAGEPFTDAPAHLRAAYARGLTDEFIAPAYRASAGGALGRIRPGDAIIMFNFREDSVREMTSAFIREPFDVFPRERLRDVAFVTMTEYDRALTGVEVAFAPIGISWPLGRVLAANGKRQLRVAETEKYAHVTYFFNGGEEEPFPDEDRILVPSLTVEHFDERPEMRAPDIAAKILERVGEYDFILVNFANADLVGHSGNFQAVVRAVEILDRVLGEIAEAVLQAGGTLIVTADHGNAEQKIHPVSGEPVTEHTANPVPFYLIGDRFRRPRERTPGEITDAKKSVGGILSDIAPTILELMQLPQPPEMTGKSLLPMLLGRQ